MSAPLVIEHSRRTINSHDKQDTMQLQLLWWLKGLSYVLPLKEIPVEKFECMSVKTPF